MMTGRSRLPASLFANVGLPKFRIALPVWRMRSSDFPKTADAHSPLDRAEMKQLLDKVLEDEAQARQQKQSRPFWLNTPPGRKG